MTRCGVAYQSILPCLRAFTLYDWRCSTAAAPRNVLVEAPSPFELGAVVVQQWTGAISKLELSHGCQAVASKRPQRLQAPLNHGQGMFATSLATSSAWLRGIDRNFSVWTVIFVHNLAALQDSQQEGTGGEQGSAYRLFIFYPLARCTLPSSGDTTLSPLSRLSTQHRLVRILPPLNTHSRYPPNDHQDHTFVTSSFVIPFSERVDQLSLVSF